MKSAKRGFTLVELLAVIAIITLLIGIILPSLTRGRSRGQTLTCLTHLREIAKGWQSYADENADIMVPGRVAELAGGKTNDANYYDVGNGFKYRARWLERLSHYISVPAFNIPDRDNDRQDFDGEIYRCPSVPDWKDSRNSAYGYNHQFLGNGRLTNGFYHNYPVKRHRVKAPGSTVVAADCLGTAAGIRAFERGSYRNDGNVAADSVNVGNHAYTLDPPRLTPRSDRGTGEAGSPRTAVDPRHEERANAVFADGHGQTLSDRELGYRKRANGRYVDSDPDDPMDADPASTSAFPGADDESRTVGIKQQPQNNAGKDVANNSLFSGTGRDDDPPPVPGK
ncbi:MAG: prepilin-type N-terminal cleavage/methylation domain-containing protein [Planctomycetes bacterium]|nr:prepilin-type N-terminal cleavage/methylation domain-containing protein [Planctomycetota bacterium]